MSKRERWIHTIGERPNVVSVYEREPGGVLYCRIWDPTRGAKGAYAKCSLKHRDRERAKIHCAEQHAKLVAGLLAIAEGRTTVARLFALYEKHRTPRKAKSTQKADRCRSEMWARFLGGQKDAHAIALREWETFQDLRRSGMIDARGQRVPEEDRQPVRARTVEADLKWLNAVFNWGTRWRTQEGSYLLRENPVRGFEIPTEKNPRRPVATEERCEAIRAVARDVTTEYRWNGKHETRASSLLEIFDVAVGTGRRLSSVLGLRYDDLLPDGGPHGSMRWRADLDKTGRETVVPIGPDVRAAIERRMADRPGIGGALVFPSPADPSKPVATDLADKWLRKAEELAGLTPHDGSLWHAYRRMWATARKHLPAVDVAKAGGWKGTRTLETVYQQADHDTMLRVVLEPAQVREAR